MRYCKQKNEHSCGPIAILNVMKALGRKATYKSHYKLLSKQCRTNKDGTWDKYLTKALKLNNLQFKIIKHPKLKDIDKALKNNKLILMGYYYYEGSDSGHYTVIIKKANNYLCLNESFDNGEVKTQIWINPITINEYLLNRDNKGHKATLWIF